MQGYRTHQQLHHATHHNQPQYERDFASHRFTPRQLPRYPVGYGYFTAPILGGLRLILWTAVGLSFVLWLVGAVL